MNLEMLLKQSVEQLQQWQALRSTLEAELFAAVTTEVHEPWDCDWRTARRLSFQRWRFLTGRLNERCLRDARRRDV